MLRYTIFTGENCHADVVVDNAERYPELIRDAQDEFEKKGFEVSNLESLIGNFCVWGASHNEGDAAHLTEEEIEILHEMGEVNPTF